MMAKAALKKVETQVKAQTEAKAAQPAGVKIVDGQEAQLDAASVRLLIEGWRIKGEIEALQEQLDGINARLVEAHGTGCALVATGICRASIASRSSVKIADAERLKAVLGFRFDDLVKAETVYKPEQKLIEMACDGDEPLQPAIGACLKTAKSESVTWRAER
ncbi:hypothetical protein EDC62_0206 [Tibeticola sediminis]|uniref:Uncharacterized protein n=1 Tax=Tibeticola sediminis TaxID=1917811 RepID=A0A3N4UUW5_9BURK|nr:hypothetical protein [Tibeticola sediminis]RPE72515.1 hypothetical protein EDC62_0206 [Tibeticola sediminis]